MIDRFDGWKELLKDLTPAQIEDLKRDFEVEVRTVQREMVPSAEVGTAKDPIVRKMAAEYLRLCRKPDYRRKWFRSLGDEPRSYDSIGEEMRVSRERVRQLYADVAQHDYDMEKQERRMGIGPVRQVG
jgi:hypothetical protein